MVSGGNGALLLSVYCHHAPMGMGTFKKVTVLVMAQELSKNGLTNIQATWPPHTLLITVPVNRTSLWDEPECDIQ